MNNKDNRSDSLKPIARDVVDFLSVRYDSHGMLRMMAVAEGHVMCRRPRAIPRVMKLDEWLKLSPEPLNR